MLQSRRFFFQQFVQRDESNTVILDMDMLGALHKKEQGISFKISCSVVPPLGGGYSIHELNQDIPKSYRLTYPINMEIYFSLHLIP